VSATVSTTVSTTTQDRERRLEIARAAYRDIPLYSTDKTPAAVDLRDNTNLWGVPPAAARAIADAAAAVTRYPTVYSTELKTKIAAYVGATSDMIVTGCGSDEVLDSAIRAFGATGDTFAHPEPTFHTAITFARMSGLVPVAVPLTESWDADTDAFLATKASVTYLCSPNNPTGTAMSRAALERLVAATRGLVIIDEAYAEFAGTSALDLARGSDRVLVTRTLSKAFGLAGLRIGYGVGAPALVREVEKARGPYTVNMIAERAAGAALTADLDWVRAHVAEAVANRARLAQELTALGLPPLPSAANFLLVPVARAVPLTRRLLELGVGVRPYTALPRIGDAIRITVGPWVMLESFLSALATARAEGL
jgi:histidinol-phosphate aminotransferase